MGTEDASDLDRRTGAKRLREWSREGEKSGRAWPVTGFGQLVDHTSELGHPRLATSRWSPEAGELLEAQLNTSQNGTRGVMESDEGMR